MTTPYEEAWRLHQKFGWFTVPAKVRWNDAGEKSIQPWVAWVSDGFRDGPQDAAEMERAWSGKEDAPAHAMILGEKGNVIALDPDTPEAEEYLVRQGVPRTVAFRSKKGVKRLLLYPEGTQPPLKLMAGPLEVRGEGSLLVIPPTPNYEWLPSQAPGEVDLAPTPAWVRAAIDTYYAGGNGNGSKATKAVPLQFATGLPPKEAHDGMLSIIGKLAATLPPEQVWITAVALNAGRLPEDELRELVAYAVSKEGAKTTTAPASGWPSTEPKDPRTTYFHDGRFQPTFLGREAERQARLRLGPDGGLWRYDHGVYLPDGDDWLANFARDELGDEFRQHRLREVAAWCRAKTSDRLTRDPSTDFINVKNGLLYWRETPPVLEPHDPDVVTLAQIPVEWDPTASCPRIDAFLLEAFSVPAEPDYAAQVYQFLMEWIGYCLIPTSRLKKALMLYGPGDAGKSLLLALIARLLGPSNLTSKTLQTIAENRFAPAALYGKLANICADLDAKTLKQTGMFKTITGGSDSIDAEKKFGDSFSFVPYCRLMFSANEPPGTVDQSGAYYNRWVMLGMENVKPLEERRPELLDELTTPEELSGLLRYAVAGLRSLMGRGHFTETERMVDARQEYRRKTDTVVGFVDDRCTLDPDASVHETALFEDYREWCDKANKMALAKPTFRERLPSAYPTVTYKKKYNGYPTWFGITPD